MFGADITVIHPPGFIDGQFYDLFGAWCQADRTKHNTITASDNEFDFMPNLLKSDTTSEEYFCCYVLWIT
ncbi:hypothetical protein KTH_22510 [Thermosporothrix hazakensis]|uniref:Uncharacterized protein n=1 Tax=Thermosporothrix sp. COM3 TaxID=2490863 RepID=A0A455SNG5_9CHLR|nr:hypothetical protein KTC_39510 [Thermosporothrix sp. COM3]GCE47382.1 hypothetical protein KTH_22510 [Thermosporothrix hazakensis]